MPDEKESLGLTLKLQGNLTLEEKIAQIQRPGLTVNERLELLETLKFTLQQKLQIVSNFWRISEASNAGLKAQNQVLRETVASDPLTGALNRRGLEREAMRIRTSLRQPLPDEKERRHNKDKVFSVLMLDIDFFKIINDTFGHGIGDDVLKNAAEFIRSRIREEIDVMVRWGGEEFLVVFNGMTSEQVRARFHIAETGLSQLNFDTEIPLPSGEPHRLRISFSGGAVDWDPMSEEVGEAAERADNLLYEAKASGRDRILLAPSPKGDIP